MANSEKSTDLIIIEPGAGIELGGHMREKLFVFTQRLKEKGISFHLFSESSPVDSYETVTTVDSPVILAVLNRFPVKYEKRLLELLTYWKAFRFAAKHHLPIAGLTAFSPWALLLARLFVPLKTLYFQRILYVGIHGSEGSVKLRKSVMAAYQFILGKTGTAVFNTPYPDRIFREHQPLRGKYPTPSRFISEPIYYDRQAALARNRESTLLVFGPDTPRRTPLQHLVQVQIPGSFQKILIHEPGQPTRDSNAAEGEIRKNFACEVEWNCEYI